MFIMYVSNTCAEFLVMGASAQQQYSTPWY